MVSDLLFIKDVLFIFHKRTVFGAHRLQKCKQKASCVCPLGDAQPNLASQSHNLKVISAGLDGGKLMSSRAKHESATLT